MWYTFNEITTIAKAIAPVDIVARQQSSRDVDQDKIEHLLKRESGDGDADH